MKRFWNEARVRPEEGGHGVALDGKPLRTPGKKPLVVPTARLAQAIAAEWNEAAEKIDPRGMPLTGLANAAIDRVEPGKVEFAKGLASYGGSDLLCYRAEGPEALIALQEAGWDPLLAWARRRYDVDFATTKGVVHVAQPEATTRRLAHEVEALGSFRLAGLSPLVTVGGSLVVALAILEGAIGANEAWDAVTVDESWQLQQWGSDVEAEAALAGRRRDFLAGVRFLELLED